MAMRMSSKDGRAPRNLLEGTGNLKQRYYKDKSFQENLRASQARVEQANLEAESATRLADRVDTAKNFGRSVFDFIKEAPKYIVGSTGAVLADSPFSPLRGQIRSIKIGDTEFLTPSARFQAGQDLIGQGQYKQGIREIGTGALDIASTVATPLKSLQALRVGKFGKAFLTGAVPTGLFGAGYQGLESFGADKTPAEIAKESAYAGAVSFGAGGFFGLGLAGLGKGGEMIAKRLGRGEKITPAEIAKITSESVPEKAQEVKPPVKTVDKKAETTAPKEETVSFYHRGENKATLHGGDWVDGDLKTHEGRAPADNITHIEIPKSQVSKYIREVSPEHSKEKVFRIKDGEMIPPEYIKRNDFLKKQGVSFNKPNTKASQASDDPLLQEARKYKSAEEFVKATHETTYRGASKAEWESVQQTGKFEKPSGTRLIDKTTGKEIRTPGDEATNTSPDKRVADLYGAGSSKEGVVIEFKPEAKRKMKFSAKFDATDLKADEYLGEGLTLNDVARVTDKNGKVIYEAITGGKTKSQLTDLWKKANQSAPEQSLLQEARTPKTVKVWNKSKFSNDGAYADIPVVRREDGITLYQGGKPGDKRQFWTPNKKYAEQFGNVREKTGSFYKVDNGNRMTDVYVEAPEVNPLLQEARKSPAQLGKYKVTNVPIDSLPERATAVAMTDENFQIMADFIKKNGSSPIIIDKKTGRVLDGQHRAFVSQRLGIKEIPAVYVDQSRHTFESVQRLNKKLTDLWKKANDDDAAKTTPKAEKIPEQPKPSGFAEKIKKDAIEKELAKEFPDSATYTPKTLKEEAAKTKEIFDSGIDRVVKILEGKEDLPSNIRPESFSVAAKIFAKNTGEEATRVRNALIAGKYSRIASEAGQGLSLLRDGESTTDPVRIINRIRKAREEAATKRTKSKGTNEAKKNVKTDVKKVLDKAKKVSTKETWSQFIKDIEC